MYIRIYMYNKTIKKVNLILDKMLLMILIYDKKNNLMFDETLFAMYFEIHSFI